jgi:CheY-like chemotaxis protein
MEKPKTHTILIVDDLPENIKMLTQQLLPEYTVQVATTGKKALEIARSSSNLGVILLDVMMPEMDGYEVCRQLKEDSATQKIPVIFITASNEEIDELAGLELGAADYLSKPVSGAILRARIKTQISLSSAMAAMTEENSVFSENIRLREDVERISKHDLKGPLTAIINISNMLVNDKSLTSNHIELMELLSQSALRMLEMVNRSSDLYKMEQGTYRLNLVPVNLVKIVFQVFQELRVTVERKSVHCSLLINQKPGSSQEIFEVPGEDFMFFSMLSNLVKNAVEASPTGGEVLVLLDQFSNDPPNFTISVKNRGVVPAQIRGRLFERYATYGKEGGTGLGVYSASLMAKTMGGNLSFVTSESDGTTFLVNLPLPDKLHPRVSANEEMFTERMPGSSERKPRAEMKILVVDDYPFMRRVIIDILRQDGFATFLEAGDGNSAISLLEKNPVDLVLSDWYMPGKSGLELMEYMQSDAQLKKIPFIMITANLSLPEFEKAAEKGLRNYVTKPFSSDIIRKKVKAVLSKLQGDLE